MFVRINSKIINLDHCVTIYTWHGVDKHTVEFTMVDGSEESFATVDAQTSNKMMSDILEALERGDNVITI